MLFSAPVQDKHGKRKKHLIDVVWFNF
jgi:hypothetical protein